MWYAANGNEVFKWVGSIQSQRAVKEISANMWEEMEDERNVFNCQVFYVKQYWETSKTYTGRSYFYCWVLCTFPLREKTLKISTVNFDQKVGLIIYSQQIQDRLFFSYIIYQLL